MRRARKQAAVIPYRLQGGILEIALVRTSSGKGWIVPKGSLDEGEEAWDAAVRETEEEAGLVGELTRQPIGQYRYSKQAQRYDVDVFVMRVTTVLQSWREAAHRSRRWMAVEKAIDRLDPELHAFVHATVRIVRSGRSLRSDRGSHHDAVQQLAG
jgi:8-oxo-dGTP pyrophosphatase MutT (NUDIX family)